ncbi:MAG TPA: sialidase family protein [Bryobacteraceae bacterium]|nr:sialidase family protein [Bryobacteraceae bacterium]
MPKAELISVWAGTRKGAFVFRSRDRKTWKAEGPFFRGMEVHHVARDPREPDRYYAAVNSPWFGAHIHASEDGGKTWRLSEEGLAVKSVPNASLNRVWHIEPGAPDEPGVVYAGGDPGVLFRSRDWGRTWEEVTSLTAHPTRQRWNPGAGGMCLHSIQCLGNGRIVLAISAAGAFRTTDGGASWEPFNQNVRADFQPDKYPEVGQCVHKLLAHPRNPDALYQQNHCGIYKARFGGKKWTDISRGLPTRFGFGLAVPAAEPDTLFTVPIEGAEYRCVPEAKFRVARSRDGGKTWKLLSRGLPQRNANLLTLREGMAADALDPAGVYVGTTNGQLFATATAGDSWTEIAGYLPPVISVTAVN